MYKVLVNNELKLDVEVLKEGILIGNEKFGWDNEPVDSSHFNIIKDNISYEVEVLKSSPAEKTYLIKVNKSIYTVTLKDKYDSLMEQLGINNIKAQKMEKILAPMPGLILDIRVTEGMFVKKGEPVLILEAMKMENIIKAPWDGTIKTIHVGKGNSVEKNQILISY